MLDLLAFPGTSRIWIYPSDQFIADESIPELHQTIRNFANEWQSHQEELVATGGILHNYFIVFVVDERKNSPGGCSIDKSVHFIQKLSEKYSVNFFNRMCCHYLLNEQVKTINLEDLNQAYQLGEINNDTLFFDPLVLNKEQFINEWLKPLSESWQRKFIHQ